MNKNLPTYQELEKRLAAAEPVIEALKRLEVDAVVGADKIAVLLLHGVGEALRNSEAELDTMFELYGAGMARADAPDFRFTRVNRKFCELAGYSIAELLSKTYLGLTHPLDRPRDMKELQRVLRGKADSWSIEKRCLCKNGSPIRVAVHGAVLRDDAGRAVRIMVMMSALTGRRPVQRKRPGAEGQAQS